MTIRSLRFLINHHAAKLPFITRRRERDTVFHDICKHSEIRRNGASEDAWLSTFKLLRQAFPEHHHLKQANSSGCTPLHFAVYFVDPLAVKALLVAGADPRISSAKTPTAVEPFLRMTRNKGELDMFALVAMKSPVDMAKEELFIPIPDFIALDPNLCCRYVERREEVKRTLAPFA